MKGNDKAFQAMAAFSALLMLNISTCIFYFNLIEGVKYEHLRLPVIIGSISLLVANYFIFIHKQKYIEIEKLFVKESKAQKAIGNLILILYSFISLILLILSI